MSSAGATAETTTIVGIDEAGYGPLLGPLVLGAAAFEIPVPVMQQLEDQAAGPDLWSLLRQSIKSKANRRDPRLAVADSKKLYGKSAGGIAMLERTALAFLSQCGGTPETMRDLIARVCPEAMDHLAEYPWYADADPRLPIACDPDDLATQRNALARDLEATGIRFRGAYVQLLPAGHYNRIVAVTDNKAVVLFNEAMRLILRVSEANGHRPIRTWIDRQGGRTSYRRPLMRAFEDAQLDILEESLDRSSYRLIRQPSPWIVRFVKKGETFHLPIALGSIFAKYVREVLMECFNAYWSQRVADLKPTAGYYEDGKRFMADIDAAIRSAGTDRDLLERRK